MSFSGLFLTKDLEGCHFNSNNSSYCSNKKKKKKKEPVQTCMALVSVYFSLCIQIWGKKTLATLFLT